MKKFLVIGAFFITSPAVFAQTNTFPASGNVGIGTTSPQAQLDVLSTLNTAPRGIASYEFGANNSSALLNFYKARGSIGSATAVANSDYIGSANTNAYDGSNYLNTAGLGGRVNGTVSTGSVPTDLYFYTTGGVNDVDPYTNGHVRMVIASGGDVGIGTTAPIALLNVNGTLAAGQATNAPAIVATFGTNAPSTAVNSEIVGVYSQGTSQGGMVFSAARNDTGAGEVDLSKSRGTQASPTSVQSGDKLGDVFGNAYTNSWKNFVADIRFLTEGTVTNTAVPTVISFWTTPAGSVTSQEVMRVNSAGNVGIGTTSPQATLDVTGFARLALNSSAPATCSSSNEGAVALTHLAQVCVCDTTPAWHILNTSTACSW